VSGFYAAGSTGECFSEPESEEVAEAVAANAGRD
jgi:hypothetical protein